MLTFKQYLQLEELNSKQKNVVSSWVNPSIFSFNKTIADDKIKSKKAVELSKHVIPENTDHIIISASSPTLNNVKEHLQKNGYTIHDYKEGLASSLKYSNLSNVLKSTNKDLYNDYLTNKNDDAIKQNIQQHLSKLNYTIHDYDKDKIVSNKPLIESISSILEKTNANPSLIKDFINDDREMASQMHDKDIIISRNPYHVAECSTNKKWDSCAEMNADGTITRAAAKYLPNEIKYGTHVAYLVNKTDKNLSAQERINDAISRVLLKPYKSSSGHEVLIPENKTFSIGDSEGNTKKNISFIRKLTEFTDKHFPMKFDVEYKKHPDVYDDDKKPTKIKYSENSLNQFSTNLITKLNDGSHSENDIEHAKENGYWNNTHQKLIESHFSNLIENNKVNSKSIEHAYNNKYLNSEHKKLLANKLSEKFDKGRFLSHDIETAHNFGFLTDRHKKTLSDRLLDKINNGNYVPVHLDDSHKFGYFNDEHKKSLTVQLKHKINNDSHSVYDLEHAVNHDYLTQEHFDLLNDDDKNYLKKFIKNKNAENKIN